MMNCQSGNPRHWLRTIAFVTALVFTWTSVVWADSSLIAQSLTGKNKFPAQSDVASSGAINSLFDSLDLPDSIAQIKSSFQGSRDRVVIHIQDAHVNEEAQRNISKVLQYFVERHGLSVINLEGAEGDLYTELFSFFPSKKARKSISDYFLKEGRLTGPEYLAIVERPDVKLYGVEDQAIYEENRKAYIEALDSKEQDERILDEIGKVLEGVSRHVFSDDLQELFLRHQAFQEGGNELVSYIGFLKGTAEKHHISLYDYPLIHSLVSLVQLEREIDFEKAEAEIENLTKDLRKLLSRERLSRFLVNTVQFRMKKMRRSDYYGYLEEEIKDLPIFDIEQTRYDNLLKYLHYMRLYDSIDVKVFDEVDAIERAVKSKLFRSAEEIELDRLYRIHSIYQKLFHFTLTKQDADFFYTYRDQFKVEAFSQFLTPLLEKYHFAFRLPGNMDQLEKDLPRVERFYSVALKRDRILIERAIEKMERDNQKIAAIVTGGFHTPGIERYLREHDYSYLVIAPRISKAIDSEKEAALYEQAIKQKPMPLEKLLVEAFFPPKSGVLNDPRFQLSTWRMVVNRAEARQLLYEMANGRSSREFSEILKQSVLFWILVALQEVFNRKNAKEAVAFLRAELRKHNELASVESFLDILERGELRSDGDKQYYIIPAEALGGRHDESLVFVKYRSEARYSEVKNILRSRASREEISISVDGHGIAAAVLPNYLVEGIKRRAEARMIGVTSVEEVRRRETDTAAEKYSKVIQDRIMRRELKAHGEQPKVVLAAQIIQEDIDVDEQKRRVLLRETIIDSHGAISMEDLEYLAPKYGYPKAWLWRDMRLLQRDGLIKHEGRYYYDPHSRFAREASQEKDFGLAIRRQGVKVSMAIRKIAAARDLKELAQILRNLPLEVIHGTQQDYDRETIATIVERVDEAKDVLNVLEDEMSPLAELTRTAGIYWKGAGLAGKEVTKTDLRKKTQPIVVERAEKPARDETQKQEDRILLREVIVRPNVILSRGSLEFLAALYGYPLEWLEGDIKELEGEGLIGQVDNYYFDPHSPFVTALVEGKSEDEFVQAVYEIGPKIDWAIAEIATAQDLDDLIERVLPNLDLPSQAIHGTKDDFSLEMIINILKRIRDMNPREALENEESPLLELPRTLGLRGVVRRELSKRVGDAAEPQKPTVIETRVSKLEAIVEVLAELEFQSVEERLPGRDRKGREAKSGQIEKDKASLVEIKNHIRQTLGEELLGEMAETHRLTGRGGLYSIAKREYERLGGKKTHPLVQLAQTIMAAIEEVVALRRLIREMSIIEAQMRKFPKEEHQSKEYLKLKAQWNSKREEFLNSYAYQLTEIVYEGANKKARVRMFMEDVRFIKRSGEFKNAESFNHSQKTFKLSVSSELDEQRRQDIPLVLGTLYTITADYPTLNERGEPTALPSEIPVELGITQDGSAVSVEERDGVKTLVIDPSKIDPYDEEIVKGITQEAEQFVKPEVKPLADRLGEASQIAIDYVTAKTSEAKKTAQKELEDLQKKTDDQEWFNAGRQYEKNPRLHIVAMVGPYLAAQDEEGILTDPSTLSDDEMKRREKVAQHALDRLRYEEIRAKLRELKFAFRLNKRELTKTGKKAEVEEKIEELESALQELKSKVEEAEEDPGLRQDHKTLMRRVKKAEKAYDRYFGVTSEAGSTQVKVLLLVLAAGLAFLGVKVALDFYHKGDADLKNITGDQGTPRGPPTTAAETAITLPAPSPALPIALTNQPTAAVTNATQAAQAPEIKPMPAVPQRVKPSSPTLKVSEVKQPVVGQQVTAPAQEIGPRVKPSSPTLKVVAPTPAKEPEAKPAVSVSPTPQEIEQENQSVNLKLAQLESQLNLSRKDNSKFYDEVENVYRAYLRGEYGKTDQARVRLEQEINSLMSKYVPIKIQAELGKRFEPKILPGQTKLIISQTNFVNQVMKNFPGLAERSKPKILNTDEVINSLTNFNSVELIIEGKSYKG
ncbi:MAG: hypothetical protein HY447_01195, partial [Candidatus Omnitrophica bacterium]|nr:hypothetical protein [Candidatus Omnitrophota bacterium]